MSGITDLIMQPSKQSPRTGAGKAPMENKYLSLLSKNKGKEFVSRILNPGLSPTPLRNSDGYSMTHQMAAEVDDEGNWWVFPTIVNMGGELKQLPLWEAFDYAKKTGERLPFKTMESAVDFSKNYKPQQFINFR